MRDQLGQVSAATQPNDVPLCDGRFRLGTRLGMGSQAETFEAEDCVQHRNVAIKRFNVQGATRWKDVELAEREAKVLSGLRHPALPEYVHHFEEAGALYLVMTKVEGQDLSRCLESGYRFSFQEILALLETLADVFSYLHGQHPPVIHRDIKPSNIVRRGDGGFSLIDFGSVRDGLRPAGGSTVVGTFGFMAPEQFQGRAMPATDLYGTGATVLTLLTGITPDRLPHRGLEIDVRAALPANTPQPWLELLDRLLSADPDKRTVELKSLLVALNAATETQPDATHAQPRPPEPQRAGDPAGAPAQSSAAPYPAQSEWVVGAGTSMPFIVLVVLALLRVALYLVMQVAIPTLLNLLSIFLGRGLRRSAQDVSHAGERASRQLSELIERIGKSGPMVVGRQHRMGPLPSDWQPQWKTPTPPVTRGPSRSPNHRRRMRIGNFDVELPSESDDDDASAHRKRHR